MKLKNEIRVAGMYLDSPSNLLDSGEDIYGAH